MSNLYFKLRLWQMLAAEIEQLVECGVCRGSTEVFRIGIEPHVQRQH
jgi:hypothetical protein